MEVVEAIAYTVKGVVQEYYPLYRFKNRSGKQMEKRIMRVAMDNNRDGFFELRNDMTSEKFMSFYGVGERVEIKFFIEGSRNNNMRYYNNLIVLDCNLLLNEYDDDDQQ